MIDEMEIGYKDRKVAEDSIANKEQPSTSGAPSLRVKEKVLTNELQMANEFVDVADKVMDVLQDEGDDIFTPRPQDTIDVEGDYEPDELVNQFVGTKEFLQLSPDVQSKLMTSFGIKGLNPKSNLYNKSMHALPAFMLKGNTKYIGNLIKNINKSGAIKDVAPTPNQETEEEVLRKELGDMIKPL